MTSNLFIIGAPKCGTSSLFGWLTKHPKICGCNTKEPFYFTDPSHPLSRRPNFSEDGLIAFDALFPSEVDTSYKLEATTHYLFDPFALESIKALPDARIVIVLREPATRVYSSFKYTANNLARLPSNFTFSDYVKRSESGKSLWPKVCKHAGSAYVLENDIQYSRYANYVLPWLRCIGRSRIKIIVMEEMVRDPDKVVSDLLIWLGLDPSQCTPVDKVRRNQTQRIRFPGLQLLTRNLSLHMSLPDPLKKIMKKGYAAMQYKSSNGLSIDDATALNYLRESYVTDNEALGKLISVNLRFWDMKFIESASKK